MVVPVVVIDVAVRVPVLDAVGVAMRMRMSVVGRGAAGPFGHTASFGLNVGKTRQTLRSQGDHDGSHAQENDS
jgi:hypothetical protein